MAVEGHQLLVGAVLDDAPAGQHHDLVGHADRREPVGDQDGDGAPFADPAMWIPEAARLLRPGGRLAWSWTSSGTCARSTRCASDRTLDATELRFVASESAGEVSALLMQPRAARALLAEAGYPAGFEITLSYPDFSFQGVNMDTNAQKIQADLAEAGITVTLSPGELQTELEKYRTGQECFGYWFWGPDILDPVAEVVRVLENNPRDIPFFLFYLLLCLSFSSFLFFLFYFLFSLRCGLRLRRQPEHRQRGLDLDAVLWLEDYLRSYPGALLLISCNERGSSTADRRAARPVPQAAASQPASGLRDGDLTDAGGGRLTALAGSEETCRLLQPRPLDDHLDPLRLTRLQRNARRADLHA